MNRAERLFVIFYWTYMLLYACCFILLVTTGWIVRWFPVVMPFHFFGMFLGIPLLFVVFRDIYKRDFPNPNMKVTWTILILMFWPTILVYLYKHGFRTRQSNAIIAGEPQNVPACVIETCTPYQSPGA